MCKHYFIHIFTCLPFVAGTRYRETDKNEAEVSKTNKVSVDLG